MSCNEIATSAARSFRLGMEAQGSEELTQLIDCLLQRIQAGTLHGDLNQFLALVKDILAAQERGDFIGVADLVEYCLPKT